MNECDAHVEAVGDIEARADILLEWQERLVESLVELREHHGLSQAEVASRMGVTQPTVSAFERYDANPTLSTLRRYALAVGARLTGSAEDDIELRAIQRQFEAIVRPSAWTVPQPTTLSAVSWEQPRKVVARAG